MITFYYFTHRFKRSMLEIIPTEPSFDLSWEHVSPLYKEQFLANVTFSVVTGKKSYDIIRVNQDIGVFYSKKIINVLSQFVDMSDKCYPIKIEGLEEQYYVIYNLEAYPYWNRDEDTFLYDPCYFGMQDPSTPIFGIEGTLFIMISEEVKNALLKNKVSNIELIESFGCSLEEYKEIKKSKFKPEVHAYRDR